MPNFSSSIVHFFSSHSHLYKQCIILPIHCSFACHFTHNSEFLVLTHSIPNMIVSGGGKIITKSSAFFNRCPTHPNPLISSTGNYSLADLHCQYKKYIHKRPKHILLQLLAIYCSVFSIVHVFHCCVNINLTRQTPPPLLLLAQRAIT